MLSRIVPPFIVLFLALLLPLRIQAQDFEVQADEGNPQPKDEGDSWDLVLALIVVIVAMGLLSICLIVVICELRISKPSKKPEPKPLDIELVDVGIQTEEIESPIAIHVSVPSSSTEIIEPEPIAFEKCLDGLYNLTQQSVYGRHATVIQATMVRTPREVVLKVYEQVDPALHEHAFYSSFGGDEGTSVMHHEARTFLPELIDAGQITLSERSFPALVLEKGHFSLRNFVIPKKDHTHYVVLSEKSTFFQICNSLKFVHKKGFTHGDLHVGSVMFFGSRWKLIDFSSWGNAQTDMVCRSTPHYTAPEVLQALARGHSTMPASQAVDIWGLGTIAWEILTKKPILSNTEFSIEMVQEMGFNNIPYPWEQRPAQFWSEIKSPAAKKIVQNCMHRDPAQRWTIDKIIQYMQFWA